MSGRWHMELPVLRNELTAAQVFSVSLSGAPAGIGITPGSISLTPPLNPGQGTNLSVSISSTAGPTNFCFHLSAVAEDPVQPPCTIPHCLTLPACCNRVVTNKLTYVSNAGATSIYNYQITIQNVSGNPIKYVGFGADQSCVTFLPPLIDLTLPAFGGPSLLLPAQTRTLTLQVQKMAPCPGSNTFYISTLTSNLVACCSTKVQLPKPNCIYLVSPYDRSVVLTNTPVLLKAIPNPVPVGGPCGFGVVLFYQDAALVGTADHDPYEVTVVPVIPGTYEFTAVSVSSTGEMETSDPAELTVVAPAEDPNHDHPPGPFSVGVPGTSILLNLPALLGHHYAIQYRTNLVLGQWKTLETFDGNGTIKVITDSVTNDPSRFYRAVEEP